MVGDSSKHGLRPRRRHAGQMQGAAPGSQLQLPHFTAPSAPTQPVGRQRSAASGCPLSSRSTRSQPALSPPAARRGGASHAGGAAALRAG